MSDHEMKNTKTVKRKTNARPAAPSRKKQKQQARGGKIHITTAKVKHKPKSVRSADCCEDEKTRSAGGTSDVERNEKGQLVFKDHPEFTPNLTPKEILQAGSFGGTYFRPIYSSITKQHYKDIWKELPKDWLEGLNVSTQVGSSTYRENVNCYHVKCGGSLEMWESSGWIHAQDSYGWFQWYCRFYQGRRTEDDKRQISRWAKCAGVKGRWRNNLITKVLRSGCAYDNYSVSPVVRQTLQHWGYRLTLQDYKEGAKRVKVK